MTKGWLDRLASTSNVRTLQSQQFFSKFLSMTSYTWKSHHGGSPHPRSSQWRGINPFPNKLTTISGETHGGTPPTHPFLEPFKTGREPFCWRARSWCSWRPWPPLLLVFPCPKKTKWGTQNLLYFKGNIILIVQGQATFKRVKSQKFDKSWIMNHKCSPKSLEGPRLS